MIKSDVFELGSTSCRADCFFSDSQCRGGLSRYAVPVIASLPEDSEERSPPSESLEEAEFLLFIERIRRIWVFCSGPEVNRRREKLDRPHPLVFLCPATSQRKIMLCERAISVVIWKESCLERWLEELGRIVLPQARKILFDEFWYWQLRASLRFNFSMNCTIMKVLRQPNGAVLV